MNTEEIAIRSIQHYLYCPHRWGLIEIDKAWAENLFVTKANLLHERVHNPDNQYASRGKKIFSSVPVYHDLEPYYLYGMVDCLEATPDRSGISIDGLDGKYQLCIVEYKPTAPRDEAFRRDDLMQVFAQKLCVDFVFGGDAAGVLYYGNTKKRVNLPLKENFELYDHELKILLEEMRDHLKRGRIPQIRKGQKCSGCSMKDLCMPSLKGVKDIRLEIERIKRTTL